MGAQLPPGSIAPVETGTPAEAQSQADQAKVSTNYGPNNETLPDEYQNCLKFLLDTYKNEGQSTRRSELRRIRQAREFWKGLQYIWWNENDARFHLPFELINPDAEQSMDQPRYMYVTNYFQAFGLSIIAVLSQDLPTVKLWPQSSEQEEDIATAKAGSDIIEVVERNNNMPVLAQDEAFYLWTDGKVGGYVRYVIDGARFGFRPEPMLEKRQQPFGEDAYLCPQCGTQVPATRLMASCPQCGQDLNEADLLEAPLTEVPVQVGMVDVPNGAEVVTLVGGLELLTPPWADEQYQFPYLVWQMEAHMARLRAMYPHIHSKLQGFTVPEGAQDAYGRTVRLEVKAGGQVTESGDVNTNLVTFERAWLRPEAFYLLDDKPKREFLLNLFPKGCYCAFAGTVYCESRNESMDDHWRILHAMPGDGQDRNALGTSFISVQERINTLANIEVETIEQGLPTVYVRNKVLDLDALRDQVVEPGMHYPVQVAPDHRVADAFFVVRTDSVSPDLYRTKADLTRETAQFLTGAFPALFGGDTGTNDTLGGITIQRDQALGRVGMVWRRMKQFHAELMLLAVEVFRKNRPEDIQLPLWGPGGEFKSRWIRKADLKGNIFAYPETDEQYPTVWAQQRNVLLQLMQTQDPLLLKILGDPSNLTVIKQLIGLDRLNIPDEDSRTKQYREIEQLLLQGPIPMGVPGGQLDDAEQPLMRLTPTVMVDPLLDDHAVEFETIQGWANSEAGQEAKVANPAGFANVRAHAEMHFEALKAQMPVTVPPPGVEENNAPAR